MSADKPRRLGRGLEALLANTSARSAEGDDQPKLQQVPITQIRPNPYQPRKEFSPEDLADLEASLRASGLLQPITLRRPPVGSGYELIAGERRLRAATRLGWKEIPALIREIDDRTLLTLALVENLQRADLNPLEEAEGYKRLMEEFELTQQQVADAVGKDRSTVANLLRVLALPASVRRMLADGEITLGHARALLALDGEQAMAELAREIVASGLTVRDVEKRTREQGKKGGRDAGNRRQRADNRPPELRRMEDELRRFFQTDVQLTVAGGERGAITIQFFSADDLERLMELMLGERRELY
ncbi:MAG TPA: ParB/RepB/Spo0J family partition protein [Gemmatimonadaceae bacterium]|nr:ParB/RepB/Spo0J family partition protein [Gemmatimonadaceae bacterium]